MKKGRKLSDYKLSDQRVEKREERTPLDSKRLQERLMAVDRKLEVRT